MAGPIRIGLVGVGKIARDQHVPAIAASPEFELVATASTNLSRVGELPSYSDVDTLLSEVPSLEAVAVTTPPAPRFAIARRVIAAGRHLLLEKPPCSTTAEFDLLVRAAAARGGMTLFQSWHSRFAAAVEPARRWALAHRPKRATIIWHEDVHHWHPGQTWLWEPGGLGAFDPGINALSILTAILPEPCFVSAADLHFPAGGHAPVAVELMLGTADGGSVSASFDFRVTGPQRWTIEVEAENGATVLLLDGGARAEGLDLGRAQPEGEYPALYRRFAGLIASGESDADGTPLQLVADAFLRGRRFDAPPV